MSDDIRDCPECQRTERLCYRHEAAMMAQPTENEKRIADLEQRLIALKAKTFTQRERELAEECERLDHGWRDETNRAVALERQLAEAQVSYVELCTNICHSLRWPLRDALVKAGAPNNPGSSDSELIDAVNKVVAERAQLRRELAEARALTNKFRSRDEASRMMASLTAITVKDAIAERDAALARVAELERELEVAQFIATDHERNREINAKALLAEMQAHEVTKSDLAQARERVVEQATDLYVARQERDEAREQLATVTRERDEGRKCAAMSDKDYERKELKR